MVCSKDYCVLHLSGITPLFIVKVSFFTIDRSPFSGHHKWSTPDNPLYSFTCNICTYHWVDSFYGTLFFIDPSLRVHVTPSHFLLPSFFWDRIRLSQKLQYSSWNLLFLNVFAKTQTTWKEKTNVKSIRITIRLPT